MARQQNTCTKVIQSVDRAMEILDCFNERELELSLLTISNRLCLNKATVFCLINTMIGRGYMEKNLSNGLYRLGPSLLQKHSLHRQAKNNLLYEQSIVYLKRIALKYHINTYVYSYVDNILSCVDVVREDPSVKGEITSRKMAFHAAASGKLVLSQFSHIQLERYFESSPLTVFTSNTIIDPVSLTEQLEQIRKEGVAYEMEEVEEGLHAYAVPIYDRCGVLGGTLSASGNAAHMTEERSLILTDLKEAAASIAEKAL